MKNIDKCRFLFEVKLIGSSSVMVSPININSKIHEYQSPIIYQCEDGFLFEKQYYDMVYLTNRLVIPPYIKKKDNLHAIRNFKNDKERYKELKRLKNNLIEFSKSGFFGDNPNARLLTFGKYWYVF